MGSVRAVLEVLKLSSAKDLLQSLSCVNVQWYRLSTHTEVWQAYCETEVIDLTDWPDNSAQEAFRLGRLPTDTLVYVRSRIVKLISVLTLAVTKYKLKLDSGLSDKNGYCLVSRYRVICFGVQESPKVLDINVKTGAISQLPPMRESRIYPGVLRYSCSLIYLFGGRTKVCEKLDLQSKQWKLVQGEMLEPLEALTPALHHLQVYLAGNFSVEIFHIQQETFTQLPFKLPIDWWYSLCFIDKEDLVVVQSSKVSRWTIGSSEKGFRVFPQPNLGSGYYSNCPAVWCNGELYSLHNDIPDVDGVFAFSPESNALRLVIGSLQ